MNRADNRPVLFLDTAYVIALSSAGDRLHDKAVQLAEELEAQQTQLVATRAVLLEVGNALSKQRFRHAAAELLQSLEDDPLVEIAPLTEDLYRRAFALFRDRRDKEWGLIDCVSCVVMQERGITQVLTADDHFAQMGFQLLLLTES